MKVKGVMAEDEGEIRTSCCCKTLHQRLKEKHLIDFQNKRATMHAYGACAWTRRLVNEVREKQQRK